MPFAHRYSNYMLLKPSEPRQLWSGPKRRAVYPGVHES
jgi:hypothetical protein